MFKLGTVAVNVGHVAVINVGNVAVINVGHVAVINVGNVQVQRMEESDTADASEKKGYAEQSCRKSGRRAMPPLHRHLPVPCTSGYKVTLSKAAASQDRGHAENVESGV